MHIAMMHRIVLRDISYINICLNYRLSTLILCTDTGCSDTVTGRCSNGFPTRLVYRVDFPTVSETSTRLIPEMNFTCSGIITGYTAALRGHDQSGEHDPPIIIQAWRKNSSHPDFYYRTNTEIAIDETLCVGGLTEVNTEVFHCDLDKAIGRVVSVQPGDVLGLQISERSNDNITRLGFARVSSGPTNYNAMVENQGLFSPTATSNVTINSELPQITLDIKSLGKTSYKC